MNYKEKFEDFLNRMTGLLDEANKKGHIVVRVEDLENAFPELKESEDEKIRKELLDYCKNRAEKYPNDPKYKNIGAWIAWLEKQGEQKHADKVKPKFHEGEWVVYECGGETATLQITRIVEETYVFSDDSTLEVVDEDTLRLWTIQDAKDGDVLAFYSEYRGNKIVQVGIIEKYVGKHGGCSNTFKIYVGVNWENNLQIGEYMGCSDIRPATKEQRGLLFQKMKEAGYEWDAEKKELKRIEQKSDDKIKPFDEFAGLTDFERTLADICIGWTGEELGWKQYIKDNADVLLKIAIKKFKSVQDASFAQKLTEWSEEDERMYRGLHNLIYSTPCCDSRKEFSDWLNSLRPRIMGLK